jgi:hypothetical protein
MTRFFVVKRPFPSALSPLTSYLVFLASRLLGIACRLLSSPSTHFHIFPFRIVALASRLLPIAFLFLFPLASILFPITTAHSAQVTLAWDPNSEPDLAGYKIYYDTEDHRVCIDVGNQTSFTVSDLKEGKTYVFAATAYDNYGNESGFSNKVYL